MNLLKGSMMRVTVCQLDPRPDHLEQGLLNLKAHVKEQKTDFLLLPENGFSDWLCPEP